MRRKEKKKERNDGRKKKGKNYLGIHNTLLIQLWPIKKDFIAGNGWIFEVI